MYGDVAVGSSAGAPGGTGRKEKHDETAMASGTRSVEEGSDMAQAVERKEEEERDRRTKRGLERVCGSKRKIHWVGEGPLVHSRDKTH